MKTRGKVDQPVETGALNPLVCIKITKAVQGPNNISQRLALITCNGQDSCSLDNNIKLCKYTCGI